MNQGNDANPFARNLRHARRVIHYSDRLPANATPRLEWLEGIKSRYLMQVFVDEATDLSAAQLACTIELADPNLRSWFASGDLRQRVTAYGLHGESEIAWLNNVTGVTIDKPPSSDAATPKAKNTPSQGPSSASTGQGDGSESPFRPQ